MSWLDLGLADMRDILDGGDEDYADHSTPYTEHSRMAERARTANPRTANPRTAAADNLELTSNAVFTCPSLHPPIRTSAQLGLLSQWNPALSSSAPGPEIAKIGS